MFFSRRNLLNEYPIYQTDVKAIGSDVNLLDECLEYYQLVEDLIQDDVVLKMFDYMQHGTTTCYEHCINVSYYSYKMAKHFGLDIKSTARGALLHDLFLYDWHKTMLREPLFQKHAFSHPKKALENAMQYFHLNEKEQDIIVKHMWPLTIKLPRYKESYIVMFMDKYCCLLETFLPLFHRIKMIKRVNYL